MGFVASATNILFKDQRGNINYGKTALVCFVGALAFPVGLSLLMITWPAGPIAAAGLAAAGLTASAVIQSRKKDTVISPSHLFGAPTSEEKKEDKKHAQAQKCYTNFRTLVPKISEQYRQELLGNFTPSELGFIFTPDQKLEKLSQETGEAAKDQLWRIARDQLSAVVELYPPAPQNYDRPVQASYFDHATHTTKQAKVAYQWVVAAQRAALLDMIAVDRAANMVPLPVYTGEAKKDELKRSRFGENQRVDPKNPKSPEWFEVASQMRENGDWSKGTPIGKALAGEFYGYAVSKLANTINEDKAGAFDKIFNAKTIPDAWANCQIYADACQRGLIDRQTLILIAQRAEQEGRSTGNYAFYNFCMYSLANEKLLQDNAPGYDQIAREFQPSRDAFMTELRNGQPPFSSQQKIGNYDQVLANELSRADTITARLDAVKKEATKDAFGLGTQDLATNIAALSGLANGIEDEVFLGKYGWDKIRLALQNPKTKIFVAQGISRTLIGYIKSIGDMQRR